MRWTLFAFVALVMVGCSAPPEGDPAGVGNLSPAPTAPNEFKTSASEKAPAVDPLIQTEAKQATAGEAYQGDAAKTKTP
jgi:hypothetical protein